MTNTPSRPNITGILSRMTGEHAEPTQAALRLQDKFNLDVTNAMSPYTTPLVWNSLTAVNGWAPHLPARFNSPAYMLLPGGWIILKGSVGGGSLNQNVFQQNIPAPQRTWDLVVDTDSGPGNIVILPNGGLQLAGGSATAFSMDGVMYWPGAV